MSHEAEEETDDGVDGPGVQPPVVEGEHDRLLGQLVVRHRGVRREPVGPDVVEDGLSHAVEEDASAHAASEQHAEPGGIVILRLNSGKTVIKQSFYHYLRIYLTVIWPNFHITILAQINHCNEH